MINAVNELALIAPKDVTGLANELTVAMLSYNTATLRGGAPPQRTPFLLGSYKTGFITPCVPTLASRYRGIQPKRHGGTEPADRAACQTAQAGLVPSALPKHLKPGI
jgi:hypothetical protein